MVVTLQEDLTEGSKYCSTPLYEINVWLYMNIETAQDKRRGAARKYYCTSTFGSNRNFVKINTHVYY
jgi:phage terminase large subunit